MPVATRITTRQTIFPRASPAPDANARHALEFFDQRIHDAQGPFDNSEQASIARRQQALAHIQNLASTPQTSPPSFPSDN